MRVEEALKKTGDLIESGQRLKDAYGYTGGGAEASTSARASAFYPASLSQAPEVPALKTTGTNQRLRDPSGRKVSSPARPFRTAPLSPPRPSRGAFSSTDPDGTANPTNRKVWVGQELFGDEKQDVAGCWDRNYSGMRKRMLQ